LTVSISVDEYRRATTKRAQPEYDAQVRFFVLVDWLAELHPAHAGELEDVWATSNGGKRPRGEAGRMRESGQRKGVLDVECLVPMRGAHGLLIEMKSAAGKTTPEQAARMERLRRRGYAVHLARSWQEAGQILCDYLGLPWPVNAEVQVELRLAARAGERRARKRVSVALAGKGFRQPSSRQLL
jgi:hypothetical protein